MHHSSSKKIIIVSNRLPVTITKKGGKFEILHSAGGLSSGVGALFKSFDNAVWIGWPGITDEKIGGDKDKIIKLLAPYKFKPVFFAEHDLENFYYGFCNKIIWPLFHYFTKYVEYNDKQFKNFKKVNQLFSDAVLNMANQDDIIWIHDYHLMLVPSLIRKELKDIAIGFFLHIPFPTYEIFRLLPRRKEILEGILGSDLVGFHTYDYANYFLDSVRRIEGIENSMGLIYNNNRTIKVDSYPMGINYDLFSKSLEKQSVKNKLLTISKKVGKLKLILSIDRLDYTKGILERLKAYGLFLKNNADFRENIMMIMIVVPSRDRLKHYLNMKNDIENYVSTINGKYGTLTWMPIWYLYRSIPIDLLTALYNAADIALITPLRDGMNLIAKEFIASKEDKHGVLIISEMAGASIEVGETLIVNPNDANEVAAAIKMALLMDNADKININKTIKKRLARHDVYRWGAEFLDDLKQIKQMQQHLKAKSLTKHIKNEMIKRYDAAKSVLFLLDYDGTLTPLKKRPELAVPDNELIQLLKNLRNREGNVVVIVSGRDKTVMERWLGNLDIQLVAEHGALIKRKNKWAKSVDLSGEWKSAVLPVFEKYVDRTAGSFIEEKEFSLAWHYRNAGPDIGSLRTANMKSELFHILNNFGLSMLSGHKVVEVKSKFINKGTAALTFIKEKKWDMIIAAGDDATDEELFNILPYFAYSIRIGFTPSKANYNLESCEEFRAILKEISQ